VTDSLDFDPRRGTVRGFEDLVEDDETIELVLEDLESCTLEFLDWIVRPDFDTY